VTLIGEDKFKTILTYNDHTGKIAPNGDSINTRTSWSFKIKADNFTAKDITFQNDAGFNAGQAVAVESDGDKAHLLIVGLLVTRMCYLQIAIKAGSIMRIVI
jgi:pectinesterase